MDSYDPYCPVVRFFFYNLIFYAYLNQNLGNFEAHITKLDPIFSEINLQKIVCLLQMFHISLERS